LHLSTINNPKSIEIKDDNVYMTTDSNYPKGSQFIIPIRTPEEFILKISS